MKIELNKIMKERIKKIDSSLNGIHQFYGRNQVFKVEKEGSPYILKMNYRQEVWNIKNLKNEILNLQRTKEIEGVTSLIQTYPNSGYYGAIMLKEYFPGERFDDEDKNNTNLQIKIENTIRELHTLGLANLDIANRNIIVSPDKKDIKLIEIETAIHKNFFGKIFSKKFKEKKKKDLENLEELFK